MTIKNLFSALFASALLALGCGDNVTNIYVSPDAGATSVSTSTTNNTVNNYGAALDGGATTVVNNVTSTSITNNYFGGSLDGGTLATTDTGSANAVDTRPASTDTGSVSLDTQPLPTPVTPDTALVAMKGGERFLDGSNGKFAWVQSDGALMAFDSATSKTRQVNKPVTGSDGSFLFYDYIAALAVNQDGNVAWVKRAYVNQDDKQFTCMYAMLESEIIEGVCSVPAGNFYFDGSIAFHDNVVYWAVSSDQYATIRGRWVTSSVPADERASTPFATSELNGVGQLRAHSYGTVGYMAHGQYMLLNVFQSDGPSSTASFVYAQKVDFSATSLIVKSSYNGQYSITTTDKSGFQTRGLDSGAEYTSDCSRCIALNWGDTIAAWSNKNGLKYVRLDQTDSKATFIAGATEFVLEDTTLYYIGPDSTGKTSLYSHKVY